MDGYMDKGIELILQSLKSWETPLCSRGHYGLQWKDFGSAVFLIALRSPIVQTKDRGTTHRLKTDFPLLETESQIKVKTINQAVGRPSL